MRRIAQVLLLLVALAETAACTRLNIDDQRYACKTDDECAGWFCEQGECVPTRSLPDTLAETAGGEVVRPDTPDAPGDAPTDIPGRQGDALNELEAGATDAEATPPDGTGDTLPELGPGDADVTSDLGPELPDGGGADGPPDVPVPEVDGIADARDVADQGTGDLLADGDADGADSGADAELGPLDLGDADAALDAEVTDADTAADGDTTLCPEPPLCIPGEFDCQDYWVVTCETDAQGCPLWGLPEPCPDDGDLCTIERCILRACVVEPIVIDPTCDDIDDDCDGQTDEDCLVGPFTVRGQVIMPVAGTARDALLRARLTLVPLTFRGAATDGTYSTRTLPPLAGRGQSLPAKAGANR